MVSDHTDSDAIQCGRTVEIFGLVEGNFNGSMGIVEEFLEPKQRWKVKFASGIVKNFKPDNLRVVKMKKKKKEKKRRPASEEHDDNTADAPAVAPEVTAPTVGLAVTVPTVGPAVTVPAVGPEVTIDLMPKNASDGQFFSFDAPSIPATAPEVESVPKADSDGQFFSFDAPAFAATVPAVQKLEMEPTYDIDQSIPAPRSSGCEDSIPPPTTMDCDDEAEESSSDFEDEDSIGDLSGEGEEEEEREGEENSSFPVHADIPAPTTTSSEAPPAAITAVAGQQKGQIDGSLSEILQRLREAPSGTSQAAVADASASKLDGKTIVEVTTLPRGECSFAQKGKKEKKEKKQEQTPSNDNGSAAMQTSVTLAGRTFANKALLLEHVRAMQVRIDEAGGDQVLVGEDMFLLFHIATLCPKTVEKFRAPIQGFRYGKHSNFPTKCFIMTFADGSEEPISWMKSVKEIYNPAGEVKLAPPSEVSLGDAEASAKSGKRSAQEDDRLAKRRRLEEPSRAKTGLKLLQEVAAANGHPLAARWEYPLMDESRRCFAGYLSCPLQADVLQGFWEKAFTGTKWFRPEDPRSGEPLPRRTAWMVTAGCNCTYRYGGVDVSPQEYPPWMEEIMQAFMPLCGLIDRQEWPNSCNLNLYEDGGMSVGWHADDEPLFKGKVEDCRIISVSFGHCRTFELRSIDIAAEEDARTKYIMRLSNGDVCTMEGLTQKYYQHRVPKEKATGPRINLTWRWVKKHRPECPCRPGYVLATSEPGSEERAQKASNQAVVRSESNGAALRSDRSELPVAGIDASLTMAPVRFCSRQKRTSSAAATSCEASAPPEKIGGDCSEKLAMSVSQSSEHPQGETLPA